MKRFDTDHVMKYVTCGPIVAKCRSKFLLGLLSHLQKRFSCSYMYVLTVLTVLHAVNMLGKTSIFHGKNEIEFLVTINFVDSADVGSEWFNDTIFRILIKLNISNKVQPSH